MFNVRFCDKFRYTISHLTDLSQFPVPLYWNAAFTFSAIITGKFIAGCIYWLTINKYNKKQKKKM